MKTPNTIANALKTKFSTGNQPFLFFNNGTAYTPAFPAPAGTFAGAVRRRSLTLNKDFDEYGRLHQRLGTGDNNFTSLSGLTINGKDNQGLPTWGRDYLDPATEDPGPADIEIWDIFNLTADTHPMHFHLVNVQVIQRQALVVDPVSGATTMVTTGAPWAPDDNELGWKETVRNNPMEVTTIMMKFDLPKLPTSMGDPSSPRFASQYPGKIVHEYVWHCHILEHEEHDMMRPLVVVKP